MTAFHFFSVPQPDSHPPKLLDQVRTVLRAKRYSLRTEEQYLAWIRRFILHNGKRHPGEMGEREVSESSRTWRSG